MDSIRIPFVLALAVGCGGAPPPAPEPEREPPPPETMSTESAEAQPILDELNRYCSTHDDCGISEDPVAHPGRAQTEETQAAITSRRERLRALGVEIVWHGSRFDSQVMDDVRLITSGNFAVDHVGPETYEAVRTRALARPDLYVGVFVENVVGREPDAGLLSRLHPMVLLDLVRANAPEASARAVERLLPLYRAAREASNPPPAEDEYREIRLRDRITELERL
jgi:hypothetical protein